MEQEESTSPSSLKQKLKSSLTPSCFTYKERNQERETLASDTKPKLLRTSSNTLAKTWHHHDITELKDKCRHFISHFGGGGSRHGRRHSAASLDFRYDAMSYALNFDEGCDNRNSDESPLRGFSSRLPPSPTKEINAL